MSYLLTSTFFARWVIITLALPIKTRKHDERLNATKIVLDPWGTFAPYYLFNFANQKRNI